MNPRTEPARTLAALALLMLAVACSREQPASGAAASAVPTAAKASPLPDRLGLGHAPTAARLAAIDIDANPAGVGLPPGRGTYAEGKSIFAQQCAACHGAQGQGQGPYPQLIGVAPRPGFTFDADFKIPKTIGNYWPYSTTVYDYIHRAMPLTAPGSLRPNEVYGLVAYLLAENQVVPQSFVADASTLPKVKMPAHDHFVPDDRTGGATFR